MSNEKKKLFEKYPLTLEKFCIRVFIISISKRKSCSICLWVRSLSRPEFLHSQSGKRLPFRPAWLKAMCKIIMSTKSKQTVAFSTNGGEVSITGNVIESESHTQNGQRSHLEAKMARGLQCVKCKQNNPKLHKKCANSAFLFDCSSKFGFSWIPAVFASSCHDLQIQKKQKCDRNCENIDAKSTPKAPIFAVSPLSLSCPFGPLPLFGSFLGRDSFFGSLPLTSRHLL